MPENCQAAGQLKVRESSDRCVDSLDGCDAGSVQENESFVSPGEFCLRQAATGAEISNHPILTSLAVAPGSPSTTPVSRARRRGSRPDNGLVFSLDQFYTSETCKFDQLSASNLARRRQRGPRDWRREYFSHSDSRGVPRQG